MQLYSRSSGLVESLNHTLLKEFHILGLSQNPHLQVPIFVVFLLMYSFTLIGNLLLIAIIYTDSQLQTPMYFFLMNLSLLDMGFTTVTMPKLLSICSTGKNAILFNACIFQFYLSFSSLSAEFFLLSVMAYDRYVAICKPLHYAVIMRRRVQVLLAAASWTLGFLDTIPHAVFISQLSFCGSSEINHFFCDLAALLKLSCTDTSFINVATYAVGFFIGVGPFLLTMTSYILIITKIVNISSSTGRRKSFSTCSSHLIMVALFYGTELGVYLRPTSEFSLEKDKLFAVLYTVVIPMLNPLVYSLRNNDVKQAIAKARDRLVLNMFSLK